MSGGHGAAGAEDPDWDAPQGFDDDEPPPPKPPKPTSFPSPGSADDEEEFLATSSDEAEEEDDDGLADLDFSADFDSQRTNQRRGCRCLDWCLALCVLSLTVASLVLLIQAVAAHRRTGSPSTASPVSSSSSSPTPSLRVPPVSSSSSPATGSPISSRAPLPPTRSPLASSSPTLQTPKPSTLSPTLQPTAAYILDDDSPITSFADPRYGSATMNISRLRKAQWTLSLSQRTSVLPTLITVKPNGDYCTEQANTEYDSFCAAQQAGAIPVKYRFPVFPMQPLGKPVFGLSFDPSFAQKHLRQFRHALAEYYEQEEPVSWWYPALQPPSTFSGRRRTGYRPPAPPIVNPAANKAVVERLASIFYKIIMSKRKKIVMGFMGSSVMSGQDNCHDYIYSEQMKRRMEELLSFANISVEARNMGQNGDGPDMPNQMLCAPDTLGDDVDLLTLWYPMIPNPRWEETYVFLLRWFLRGVHVHILVFPFWEYLMQDGWVSLLGGFNGYTGWMDQGDYSRAYNWPCGTWGRHGDGRCHTRTREGAPGVFMQNWHYGPLGFQVLVDSALSLYSEALVLALDYIKGAKPLPVLNTTTKFTCFKPLLANDSMLPVLLRDFDPGAGGRQLNPQTAVFNCDSGSLKTTLKVACATGYGPRFSADSSLQEAWYIALDTPGNPFASNASNSAWAWQKVKSSSRGNGWESDWYDKQSGLNCADFPDIAFAFQTSGKSRTNWLTFKMLEQTHAKLVGSKSMRVLACYGSRAGNWGVHPQWTAHYGAQGHELGTPLPIVGPYYYSNCHTVVRNVPVPAVGEIFGIYFDFGNEASPFIRVETVALLGEV